MDCGIFPIGDVAVFWLGVLVQRGVIIRSRLSGVIGEEGHL
jgi:hypothetical protein